jgi:hypothetical protein
MLAACWLAVIKAGCIAVTTMPLLRERELGVIADKARINAALCDASLLPAWQAVAQERSQRGLPCPTLGYGNDDPAGLEAAMARHDAPFAAADTAQDDVALIAFTSGTTGVPKGTMRCAWAPRPCSSPSGVPKRCCKAWPTTARASALPLRPFTARWRRWRQLTTCPGCATPSRLARCCRPTRAHSGWRPPAWN